MRHQKDGRKLGRTSSHRKALLRNMVASLFECEKIETTDAKAKELKRFAEKTIAWGKRGDLHARRQALRVISNKKTVRKLFDEIAPRFKERNGGYTRIVKAGRRRGDNAPLSIIELIPREEPKSSAKGAKESKGKDSKKKSQGKTEKDKKTSAT